MNDRNAMIEANLKYARAAATKFTFRAPRESVQWQEAFSAACEALVKAASVWSPDGGANLGTYAWPSMKREVLRLRQRDKRRYETETLARHSEEPTRGLASARSCTATFRDFRAEGDEFRAGLSESPEELLLLAEDRAEKLERLARVPESQRLNIEAVLDGKSPGQYVRLNAVRLAAEAGVRVGARDVPEKKTLTPSERWRRYYARLSPEKRQAQEKARRNRKSAKRARMAVAA